MPSMPPMRRTTLRLVVTVFLLPLLLAGCGTEPAVEVEVPAWAHVAPEQIAAAKEHGVPVAFENELGMRFVLIPAGHFTYAPAEPEDDPGAEDGVDENGTSRLGRALKPMEPVAPSGGAEVARPYYVQITEVTVGQYAAVDAAHRASADDGADDEGRRLPVSAVSRKAAQAFARKVGCRLPTEAEWARAAQGGVAGQPYPWGAADAPDRRNGPGGEDGFERKAPVASYAPNAYGLYDVVGNVWEYCADTVRFEGIGAVEELPVLVVQTEKAEDEEEDAEDDTPETSPFWLIRGGSWMRGGPGLRTAARAVSSPFRVEGEVDVGFRLVAPLPERSE